MESISPSQCTRKDSLDLLSLPRPVSSALETEPSPFSNTSVFHPTDKPSNQSVFEHSTFFNNAPNGLVDDMTLPEPVLTAKRELSSSTISSPVDNDLYEDEEVAKKKRRLAKNREIAKNCRKRKKEKKEAILDEVSQLESIQLQIQTLREENSRLRQRLESVSSETAESEERNQVRVKFLKRMRELMEKKDEEAISKEIDEYYSRWSEFGIERLSAAQIHLEQLKMLLLPTQVVFIVVC